MSTFIIAQRAISPAIIATLTDVAGNPVDLSAALSVVFLMTSGDGVTTVINSPATIFAPATGGKVSYQWQVADTANAGTYLSRFIVTFVNGSTMQFPDRGFDRIIVSQSLPSLTSLPTPDWSYSGDPITSPRDAVRFLIADTNPKNQLLQDSEIQWLLSENVGYYSAAAEAARILGARYAALGESKKLGDLATTFTRRAQSFFALSKELMIKAMRTDLLPTPYAGGLSQAEKDTDILDTDLVSSQARRSSISDIYLRP